MMINLNKLHHASVIAEEGTFVAAANRLNITHSALSRSIQTLEAYFTIRLFERSQAGAKLTPEGASFLKIADDLLRTASYADSQMRLLRPAQQMPIKFGMGSVSLATCLPALMPSLVEDGSRLQIRVGSISELQLLLRHGEIEFFVGSVPRGGSHRTIASDLACKEIFGVQRSLLVRNGHPLLTQELHPLALGQYPVAAGFFVRDELPPTDLEGIGLQSPSIECDDYNLLAALVRDSDYILIASDVLIVARQDLGLSSLPIRLGADEGAEWALIYSAQRKLSPAADRAASLINDRMKHIAALVSHPR
jgi:DNA-binding transcriptional LysR family regulator